MTPQPQQIRRVMRAVSDLRLGCAYLPTGSAHVDAINHHLAALRNELSAINWGR